ncbi:sterol 26-hydroxylase, mitochondrial [Alligator sinensis]|uniref:Sterol 26-hydroxylase, mitochondrial n=1 Tax=Alligator sinensis TaxID=38654 RepID=A0A3Q0FU04_ALLSI|nr:sterol 26-hydroxylase, mitochondrial [Alligator sinensis]
MTVLYGCVSTHAHHYCTLISKQAYGPLWKSSLGPYTNINVACPELLEQVLRQEGKYPVRSDMALWKEHRDARGLPYGPFTEDGERWHRLRPGPREAVLYTGTINAVTSDLLGRLEAERRGSPSGRGVGDVASLLYRFALEGIASILFETRIGCLEPQVPPETQRFIAAIGCMFRDSVFVTALPAWTRALLPFWDRYLRSWDTIFAFGPCQRGGGWAVGPEAKGAARAALPREVTGVGGGQVPDAPHLAQMPLLKAIVKETLRLYPVVPTNARIIVEKDVVVGDYLFPKDTLFVLAHYAMAHDEHSFPEPERFLPQRWLRAGATPHHPFSSIPFGYGVRACVGRRIAELEMYLALTRIIQNYELHPDPRGREVHPLSRIVLVPDKPINLELVARAPVP